MYIVFMFLEDGRVRKIYSDYTLSIKRAAGRAKASKCLLIQKSGKLHVASGLVKRRNKWQFTTWKQATPEEHRSDTLKNTFITLSAIAE